MTRETIEEMIVIGIEFLTVALFLVFVVGFNGIKNDFADVKNTKINSSIQMKQYREYGKYETGFSPKTDDENFKSECLYADDVIEAIRKYKDGSIEIFVDKPNSSNTPFYLTKTIAEQDPEYCSMAALTTLLGGIDSTGLYHPYLFYNGDDMKKMIETDTIDQINFYSSHTSGTVTGIGFIRY